MPVAPLAHTLLRPTPSRLTAPARPVVRVEGRGPEVLGADERRADAVEAVREARECARPGHSGGVGGKGADGRRRQAPGEGAAARAVDAAALCAVVEGAVEVEESVALDEEGREHADEGWRELRRGCGPEGGVLAPRDRCRPRPPLTAHSVPAATP